MINAPRLQEEFIELVSISSPSKREGTIARRLEAILKSMGGSVEVDGAGEKIEGNTGNLLARFPGNTPGAPPFLLSGHMDTVGPAEKIRPMVEGDVVRTDGTSVLGGDDKAGVVAILEAIRVLREKSIPHGDIEVVLTICEEYGLLGAKHFDTGRLRARRGLVLDVDGVCELITRAPAANRMAFTVHGLPAHAGICPEQGMSAIQIAAEAIAAMKLGRVDAETTANLGLIQGGLATNIVPAMLTVRGEARSLNVEKLEAQTLHMRRCFDEAVAPALGPGGRPELSGTGRGPGRPAVLAARHPERRLDRPPGAGRRHRHRSHLRHALHRGRLGRQRLRGARPRGRQPRLRDARDPHRERVGRRARPGAHRRPGGRDRPPQRRALTRPCP